ncbi:MAG: thioredoxin domain-containing protein, partial [Chitinophagaceae bacterium]
LPVALKEMAENLTQHLQKLNAPSFISKDDETIFDIINPHLIAEKLMENADQVFGGFGGAPKFPQTAAIIYLLRQFLFGKKESHLQQALLSLDKMMQGGIYDQIGGGFARYSTDEKWLAPHFEKMLYDNALLLMAYTEAYQLTKDKKYKVIILQTFQFLEREMMDKKGGFYSALDADSEGVEGKFYTWKKNEIEDILGNDASLFCQVYNVQENGNWENTNILWLPVALKEMAENLKITIDVLLEKLNICREKLLIERNKRIRPATDTKILSGWNALLIAAYCKASMALNDDILKKRAISTMEFLEKNCLDKNEDWLHAASENPRQSAFLDDQAYIIQAYILLQEMTGETKYLDKAKSLAEFVIVHFSDSDNCLFYFTPQMQNDILYRKIEIYDSATPSGNALMAQNLFYLSKIYDLKAWEERSMNMLQTIGKNILLHPLSFGNWALQVQAMIAGIPEIVITGAVSGEVRAEILQLYLPSRILQSALSPNDDFPMLKEKIFDKRNAMIYLCHNYSCEKPVKSAEQLFLLLKY